MNKITRCFVYILIIAIGLMSVSCKMMDSQETQSTTPSETAQAADTAKPSGTDGAVIGEQQEATPTPSVALEKPALEDTFAERPALNLKPGETAEATSPAVKATLDRALPLMQYAVNFADQSGAEDIEFPAGDLAAWPILYDVVVNDLADVSAQGIEKQGDDIIIDADIVNNVIAKSCFAAGEMPKYYDYAEYADRIGFKDGKYYFDSAKKTQPKADFSPKELYVDSDGTMHVLGNVIDLEDENKNSGKVASIVLGPVDKSLFGYALVSINTISMS